MSKHDDNFYHAIIKRTFPDAHNIRKPHVLGWVAPAIYIVDTQDQTIICKFNQQEIILHNKHISDLLTAHNIDVPKTTAHNLFGTWFETYQYNPEKTLHELIENGISDEHIFIAYKKALEIQQKISQINISDLSIPHCPRFFDIVNCCETTSLYRKIFYLSSLFGKQHLLHNDIYPRNILYSPETHEVHLIDLDSIAISNMGVQAISFFRNYPCQDTEKLMQEYQHLTGHKPNPKILWCADKILHAPGSIKRKIKDIIDRCK